MKFNKLEKAILKWFLENTDDAGLREQLSQVSLKSRKYTGAGFFVGLTVPEDAPRITEERADINAVPGPYIESASLEAGADTALFINDGVAETLEIFAYGDSFPEVLDEYVLINLNRKNCA